MPLRMATASCLRRVICYTERVRNVRGTATPGGASAHPRTGHALLTSTISFGTLMCPACHGCIGSVRLLIRKPIFVVSGHCRYATALHGRQLSLLQMEGAYRGVERGQRPRSSINSRSVFRPPSSLRNLATDRGRVVRELLSHYNNDPLQAIWNLTRIVLVPQKELTA